MALRLLLLILTISLFAVNLFAQNQEVLDFIALETCTCLSENEDVDTFDEYIAKIETCLTTVGEENADIIEAMGTDSTESFSINNFDEAFGERLGQNLALTCPTFLNKIQTLQAQLQETQTDSTSGPYETLLVGNKYLGNGDCETANTYYTQIINSTDSFATNTTVTAYNNRGYCKTRLGDFYGAISDLTKALEIDSKFNLAYTNRGEAKKYIGDYNGAVSDFEKAIEISPNNLEAFNHLGLTYYEAKDYETAYTYFDKALEVDSSIATVWYNVGLLDNASTNYQKALISFDKAYQRDSSLIDISYYKAEAYTALRLYDEAISELLKDPLTETDFVNLTDLGRNYYYNSNYDLALFYFDKAIEIDSTWYLAHLFKGYTYQDSSQYELSLAPFEKAFELNTNDAEIPFYLALSYYYLEDYERAMDRFSKTIEINENYAEAYDFRARSNARRDSLDAAINDYTLSLSIYPNDPVIYLERGEIHLENGDIDSACTDFLLSKQFKSEDERLPSLILENCKEE